MAFIDKEVVLNSNPQKRLIIAFENMKADYNDTVAKAYMETYKNQPLAFIIENSRYIFAEPAYGIEFYKESVINNEYAFLFTEYESEIDKIESYLEENGNNMPGAQKKLYEDLLTIVTEKYKDTVNTASIISHACTNDSFKAQYDNLVESVYALQNNQEKVDDILTFMESTTSADLFYALTPYVAKFIKNDLEYSVASNIGRFFKECTIKDKTIDETEWKNYIESVVIVSKLYQDEKYKDAVSSLRRQNSIIFEGLAAESVRDQINELFVEHITENAGPNKFNTNTFDCFYSTPSSAVNRIFDDDNFYSIMKDENEKFKMERTNLYEIAMNILYEYVTNELYESSNPESKICGFNYFNENTSIESAFTELSELPFIIKESDDVDDNEVSELESKVNTDESSNTPAAPKDKNLANKIQNKAMDYESKFLKKRADADRKGIEVKNAVKAVTAIPKNVVDSIKNMIAEWDKMDDDRRKEYIIKPGFRKKAYRNLKLALMYGSAVSINMSLVPILFMARHFSKKKDKRIRNELARELDTEIKVCEEKISDATANGDTKEKYKLLRIKSDLEKESIRVKSNSKYI